jgi:DNA-binding transcriptional LysR family regulator
MSKALRNAQASAGGVRERAGSLDWGHLRFFLEMARSGSLSKAAKRLAVDRNTVARRVTALELELGLPLFERGPLGWGRTAAGQELADLASRVEQDVLALALHAGAQGRDLTGSVRLTTTMHLSTYLLVPALPRLRERHPGLLLEIAADQRAYNLTRREADLALRMGRPQDPGLVTRKLTPLRYRFYASRSLVGTRREVDFAADPFVGYEESLVATLQERWLSKAAPGRRVVFRCNSTAALAAAARTGVGVALLPCFVAEADPGLVSLQGPEPPDHELWLLVHGELRRSPPVRAIIDWVDELVERARGSLVPDR